jgi:hypothetical protein
LIGGSGCHVDVVRKLLIDAVLADRGGADIFIAHDISQPAGRIDDIRFAGVRTV